MAVESVNEIFDGRSGADTFDGSRRRNFDRRFEVRTTSATDGPEIAGGNTTLPRLYDLHPDGVAFCVGVEPRQSAEDGTLWYVDIRYDTRISLPDGAQPNSAGNSTTTTDPTTQATNPTARPPVWRGNYERSQVIAVVDKDGDPIVNSAGDPFDPPLMVDKCMLAFSVTYNTTAMPFLIQRQMANAVNFATWRGFAARTLRVAAFDWISKYENGFSFWEVTIGFAFNEETWDLKPIDAGYRAYVGSEEDEENPIRKVVIVDATGRWNGGPALLDGTGRELGPELDPEILEFRKYPEVDYATALGF